VNEHRSEYAIILVREDYQSRTHGKKSEVPPHSALNGMNRYAYYNYAECCRRELSQGFCRSIASGAHGVVDVAIGGADVGCGCGR